MMELYTIELLRLAAAVAHYPRLEAPDVSVERRATVCGSRITIDLNFDDTGRVTACGLDVRACALGQAAAAVLAAAIMGRTNHDLTEACDTLTSYLVGMHADIGAWPGLSALAAVRDYPARHAAVRIVFEAASAAAQAGRRAAA